MKTAGNAGLLRRALREKQWELASVCLLLGMMRTTLAIPKDALPGLLEVLEGESNGQG